MRKLLHYCLFLVPLTISCTAGYESSHTPYEDEAVRRTVSLPSRSKAIQAEPVSYRIYLDNSYSMNGYFKGQTQFLSTINKLVTEMSNYADDSRSSCKLFYINNGINYYGKTGQDRIDLFLSKINNFFGAGHKGNRGVTDLKDVLNQVIDSVSRNAVSVVITDAVPSPGLDGQAASTYMDILQNSLYKAVYSKLAECDFSTIVIKCNSDFNGTYINQLNKGVPYSGKKRPYYILVMGNDEGAKKVAGLLKSASGFQASYALSNTKRNRIKSKVLVGSEYDLAGNATSLKIRRHEEGAAEMRVRLLLDLKEVAAADDYLMNPDNYVVSPAGAKLFISKVDNNGDPANRGYTHKMTVITSNMAAGQDIHVSLKYEMPQWVIESSTEQDIELAEEEYEQKTLGLQYVINGLQEGYKNRRMIDSYFSLNVDVTN